MSYHSITDHIASYNVNGTPDLSSEDLVYLELVFKTSKYFVIS